MTPIKLVLAIMAKAEPEQVERAIESAPEAARREGVLLVVAPGDPLAARRWPAGVCVLQQRWLGHGPMRELTAVLAHKELGADWVLTIDADDWFEPGGRLPEPAEMTNVDAFAIPVESRGPGWRWRWTSTSHLLRTSAARFMGTGGTELHETLAVDPARVGMHHGLVYRYGGGSTPPSDNIARLGAMTDPRSRFYYAQALKDAKRLPEAYEAFRARAAMEGSYEETFWAKLWSAKLASSVGLSHDQAISRALEAHHYWLGRAEPMRLLADGFMRARDVENARRWADLARKCRYPVDARSFVDLLAYDDLVLEAAGVPTNEAVYSAGPP